MLVQSETFAGQVIITWPKSKPGVPLHGQRVEITDADTGLQLVSALALTVVVDLDSAIVAETTMLTNADGKPLKAGEPVTRLDEGDGYRTARFRWLVVEMRTAS